MDGGEDDGNQDNLQAKVERKFSYQWLPVSLLLPLWPAAQRCYSLTT